MLIKKSFGGGSVVEMSKGIQLGVVFPFHEGLFGEFFTNLDKEFQNLIMQILFVIVFF